MSTPKREKGYAFENGIGLELAARTTAKADHAESCEAGEGGDGGGLGDDVDDLHGVEEAAVF